MNIESEFRRLSKKYKVKSVFDEIEKKEKDNKDKRKFLIFLIISIIYNCIYNLFF